MPDDNNNTAVDGRTKAYQRFKEAYPEADYSPKEFDSFLDEPETADKIYSKLGEHFEMPGKDEFLSSLKKQPTVGQGQNYTSPTKNELLERSVAQTQQQKPDATPHSFEGIINQVGQSAQSAFDAVRNATAYPDETPEAQAQKQAEAKKKQVLEDHVKTYPDEVQKIIKREGKIPTSVHYDEDSKKHKVVFGHSPDETENVGIQLPSYTITGTRKPVENADQQQQVDELQKQTKERQSKTDVANAPLIQKGIDEGKNANQIAEELGIKPEDVLKVQPPSQKEEIAKTEKAMQDSGIKNFTWNPLTWGTPAAETSKRVQEHLATKPFRDDNIIGQTFNSAYHAATDPIAQGSDLYAEGIDKLSKIPVADMYDALKAVTNDEYGNPNLQKMGEALGGITGGAAGLGINSAYAWFNGMLGATKPTLNLLTDSIWKAEERTPEMPGAVKGKEQQDNSTNATIKNIGKTLEPFILAVGMRSIPLATGIAASQLADYTADKIIEQNPDLSDYQKSIIKENLSQYSFLAGMGAGEALTPGLRKPLLESVTEKFGLSGLRNTAEMVARGKGTPLENQMIQSIYLDVTEPTKSIDQYGNFKGGRSIVGKVPEGTGYNKVTTDYKPGTPEWIKSILGEVPDKYKFIYEETRNKKAAPAPEEPKGLSASTEQPNPESPTNAAPTAPTSETGGVNSTTGQGEISHAQEVSPAPFKEGDKVTAPNGEEANILSKTKTHAILEYSDGERETLPLEDLKGVPARVQEPQKQEEPAQSGIPVDQSEEKKGVAEVTVGEKNQDVIPNVTEKPTAPEEKTKKVSLPNGWWAEVGRTRTKEGHTAEGEVDWENKRIVFSKQKHMDNPDIYNHEVAHVLIETLPDKERNALFDDYVKAKSEEWKSKGYEPDWIVKNKFHREEIAMEYGNYLDNPSSIDPKIASIFDKYLKNSEGGANAVRQPEAEKQVPRTLSAGQNIPEGSGGVRPSEQGNETPVVQQQEGNAGTKAQENAALVKDEDSRITEAAKTFYDLNYNQGIKDSNWNKFTPEVKQQQIDKLKANTQKQAEKLVAAIDNKDLKVLQDNLHTGNKTTRKLFEKFTGINLPTTQGGTQKVIENYVGNAKVKEQNDKIAQEKKTREDDRIKREREQALKKQYGYAMGGAGAVKPTSASDMYDDMLKRGYTGYTEKKQGVSTVGTLSNGKGSGYEVKGKYEREYVKNKTADLIPNPVTSVPSAVKENQPKETPEPLTPAKVEEAVQAAPKAGNTLREQKNHLLDELNGAFDTVKKVMKFVAPEGYDTEKGFKEKQDEVLLSNATDASRMPATIKALRKEGYEVTDYGKIITDIPGDGSFSTPIHNLPEYIKRIKSGFPTNLDRPKLSMPKSAAERQGRESTEDKLYRFGSKKAFNDYVKVTEGNLETAQKFSNKKLEEQFKEELANLEPLKGASKTYDFEAGIQLRKDQIAKKGDYDAAIKNGGTIEDVGTNRIMGQSVKYKVSYKGHSETVGYKSYAWDRLAELHQLLKEFGKLDEKNPDFEVLGLAKELKDGGITVQQKIATIDEELGKSKESFHKYTYKEEPDRIKRGLSKNDYRRATNIESAIETLDKQKEIIEKNKNELSKLLSPEPKPSEEVKAPEGPSVSDLMRVPAGQKPSDIIKAREEGGTQNYGMPIEESTKLLSQVKKGLEARGVNPDKIKIVAHPEAWRDENSVALADELSSGASGKKVVWFRDADVNGFYSPETKSVWINVEATSPVDQVFAHELGHFIDLNHPELYEAPFQTFVEEINDQPALMDYYKKKYGKAAFQEAVTNAAINGRKGILGEAFNDLLAERMQDPDFWKKLYNDNPEATKSLLQRIKEFIQKLKSKASYQLARFLRNKERVLDAIDDMMSKFEKKMNQKEPIPDFTNSGEAINWGRRHVDAIPKLEDLLKEKKKAFETVKQQYGASSDESFKAAFDHQLVSEAIQYAKDPTRKTPLEEMGLSRIPQPETPELQRKDEEEPGFLKKIGTEINDVRKSITDIPKFTEFKRTLLGWDGEMQKVSVEARNTNKDFKKTIKDPETRRAVNVWIESGSDEEKIKEWEKATTDPKLKKDYTNALKLTPEEKDMARQAREIYSFYLRKGKALGILNNAVENYVNRLIDTGKETSGQPSLGTAKLMKSFRAQKSRVFPTTFDAEQAGYKTVSKDIADLLSLYISEFGKVAATKQLIKDLSGKKAEDGRPLAVPAGVGVQVASPESKAQWDIDSLLIKPRAKKEDYSDYKGLNHYALSKWKWLGETPEGAQILIEGDMLLHPEIYKTIKNVLGHSAIRDWYQAEGSVFAGIPKMIVKAIDSGQSVVKQAMFSLSTFHWVQEGTHALGHTVNPFYNIPHMDLDKNPEQMDAAMHGLKLAGDYNAMSNFREGLASGPLLYKIPGIGNTLEALSEPLFTYYIPGLKFKTYQHIYERNSKRYADDIKKGTVTESDVKYLSAQQANAAYGHLNYVDMGRNPTLQHIMRMTVLAPDFLEARGRFAGQAAKAFIGSKAGVEQLRAIAVLAVALYVAARILNKTLNDDYHLEEPFDVIAGNKRYGLRSVPGDLYNLFKRPHQFISGRVSPIVGKSTEWAFTGTDYRGQPQGWLDFAKELALSGIPISTRGLVPGASRNKDVNAFESMLSAGGIGVSRYSPVQRMYDLVDKWKDKNDIPNDKGHFAPSKYRDLRNALQDNNVDKAVTEWKKLIKESNDPSKVLSGFHTSLFKPLAGSKHNDLEFKQSLSDDDKKAYDAAEAARAVVWMRLLQNNSKFQSAGQEAIKEKPKHAIDMIK